MDTSLMPQTQALLARYGLTSLTTWAYNAIIGGLSMEELTLQLYDQPAFIARFPAIKAREKAGLPPISVDDYLSYENTASQLASTWGIPLSKAEVDGLLTNDVSAVELEERFNIAGTAVYTSPIEDRQAMMELFGVSEGRLAKYWMDPKKELPILQQEYVSAQIAGSAVRSGYGHITRSQAERLYDTGLTGQQAQQAFGELFNMRELFQPIDEVEEEIGQQEQIEFLAGSAEAATEVEKRAAKRKAEFEGGGEFAAGGEGFKGVGAATP